MKPKPLIEQSSWSICSDIAAVSVILKVVTIANVREIFEFYMVRIQEKLRVQVVKTFVQTIEDSLK